MCAKEESSNFLYNFRFPPLRYLCPLVASLFKSTVHDLFTNLELSITTDTISDHHFLCLLKPHVIIVFFLQSDVNDVWLVIQKNAFVSWTGKAGTSTSQC